MKRWARRNLPTVVLLAALILLAALVLAVAMPRETENTPVAAVTIAPTFDEAAYQSRLEAEAFAEVEHETADIPSTYDLPEPPQEANSEPCGRGGFECQHHGPRHQGRYREDLSFFWDFLNSSLTSAQILL